MNPTGQGQDPVQPAPQDPPQAQPRAQAQLQAASQPQARGASGAREKAPPRAKPGFRGIWANPEKCDTSDWNVYYYYFRQIAQHGAWKLKNLKWIGLAADIYFFLVILVVLIIRIKYHGASISNIDDAAKIIVSLLVSGSIIFNPLGILFLCLTVVPVVVVGRAFKLQVRNHGFMTSRAKEPPLLSHLVEYTSGNTLIEGVLQSFVYTYVRMLLFLLPALLLFIVTGIVAVTLLPTGLGIPLLLTSLLRVSLGIIMGSLAASIFLIMQGFCYRVDSICFVILLGAEFLFHYASLARYLISSNNILIGRGFFSLVVSWAACMVFFPLAAADTLEFGIGKHARAIRLVLLGILLINLTPLFIRMRGIDLSGLENSTLRTRIALLPSLWILAGVIGLLVSSLSAASYRAKHLFQLHMSTAKNKLLVRLFDPASPSLVIPVLVLEVVLTGLFAALTETPGSASFWNGDENGFFQTSVMIAFWVWSSLHFALTFLIFTRRYSHKERKPWLTHPQFSGTFFLILAVLGIVWLLSGGNIVFPFFYFVMSGASLFIIWESVEAPDAHGKELPADFGRDSQ